jgi:hypothetical protein
VVESTFPLRILRNEIRADSGGAGRHRGGCGLVREVEVGCDDALFSLLSDRNVVPPAGVNGGAPGAPNRYRVLRGGRELDVTRFPGKVAGFPLARGDVVVMESSGGGGFGDPRERDPAALQADLADGFVSDAGAYRSAPLKASVSADATLPEPHLCRLAPGLAGALGAKPGALVELYGARGAAHRYWVASVDPALPQDGVAVASVPDVAPASIRCLAATTPIRIDAR